jgi:hypothetical protein
MKTRGFLMKTRGFLMKTRGFLMKTRPLGDARSLPLPPRASPRARATATFVAHIERTYAAPLPRYVVETFEHYLACGDVARGVLRCHAGGCGHDVLVAFSCKDRGLCPSCGTRRMCNEAVQLVDRVLPNVPIRQWVLSLPWELRGLAATKPKVLGVMDKIFAQESARAAKRLAVIAGAETGSIGCPQLFGGSLNVHPHLHTLCADGVFERTGDGSVRFHEAPAPSKDDVGEVARRMRDRACRWLRRKGTIDERVAEERGDETPEHSAIEACTQLARVDDARGIPRAAGRAPEGGSRRGPRSQRAPLLGDVRRLRRRDVDCAVRIAADDDRGRERLVRYCTRPPLALGRIEVLRDGRIAYLMKTARKGRTHRVMTPLEFMASSRR